MMPTELEIQKVRLQKEALLSGRDMLNLEQKKLEVFKEILEELVIIRESLKSFVGAYEAVHYRELNPND